MQTAILRTLSLTLTMALASSFALASEQRSQEKSLSPIVTGSRVRVVAPSAVSGRVTGTVIEMSEESLVILADERPLRVPRQAIEQIELSTGKQRRTLKGMLIGAGIGAVVLPPALHDSCLNDCGSKWSAEYILAGVGVGAAWGAGIGALVKKDRWSSVPVTQVRLGLWPIRGGGIGASVSLTF
jgi:hypothetical protein